MRFDLTDLRVFLHACEGGSLTQAAERSHLTLAAVSARIRSLEDAMGLGLLTRHRRGVKPTPAGAVLARHAGVVFHQLAALRQDLGSTPPTAPRPTVLLGNSSALARPLAASVASVLAQHPSARITVRESGSEITVPALQMGAADIGLLSDAVQTLDLMAVDLGPDPLVAVVPPAHSLADSPALPFEALLAHEWVGWSEGSALHTHLAMHAFKAGLAIPYKVTMPSASEMLDMVARGLGIGVLPAALVPPQPSSLKVIPLSDGWAQRRLLMCRKPGNDEAIVASLAAALQANRALSAPPRTTCPATPAPLP